MKWTKAVIILCVLLSLDIGLAHAATHTVKGVVMTPEGTVVPEFSVVVKPVSNKPELVLRKHFKHGEFNVEGLDPEKYVIQISSPLYVPARLTLDFKSQTRDTDYRIIVLHAYRNEARLVPGAAYQVSAKVLQQKIPDAAREAYLKGVESHREGDLEAALVDYGTALRNYPQYIPALTDIGSILLLYNRPEAALTFLRRAQSVDDHNPIVNLNIAVALVEQSDYGAALKLLKDVLRREPRMAMAQYFTAKIHYAQKKYDQAGHYLQQALANDPKLLDAWVLLIDLSMAENKPDQARQALEHIREAAGNQAVAKFIDEQLSTVGS